LDLINEIDQLFFINTVRIVFLVGLVIEIILIVNYWRIITKTSNPNHSIFNKGNIRSPLHFIPTLLTALGILGTFWGISRGLKGIALQDIEDTNVLLSNATTLLEGMKTAFESSIWGLGSASLFILILAVTETIKRGLRNHLLKKIRKPSNENRNTQEALINQLGNVAEQMQGLATLNAQSIGEEVATALQPTFKEIQTDLNAQRQTIETQRQELLQSLVGELRTEVIEPVTTRVDESANATQEASNAVRQLNKELGGVSESIANSIQTIQQFQQRTLGQLETFAQNLKQTLDQFQTDTQGVMEQMATDIHNGVNESISGMEAQRTAFAESAEQASNTFRGIREDLQQALTTQAQQQQTMLENVQTSTEGILQKANDDFTKQSNTLTRVGSEASDMMNNASENLNSTLTNIDSMLQNTRQTVQEELERFRTNYQESLNQFFEQQNNLLEETLGQQREGLQEVVQELQRVFREDAEHMANQVTASMDKIQTTTQSVSDLANTTGLTSAERLEQIQEIARTLGSESEKINKYYENLIQHFNQGLETWNQYLTQYFEQANQTFENGRQESEQAAAEVCHQLNETSQSLMKVAQFLIAEANDLKNANGNR